MMFVVVLMLKLTVKLRFPTNVSVYDCGPPVVNRNLQSKPQKLLQCVTNSRTNWSCFSTHHHAFLTAYGLCILASLCKQNGGREYYCINVIRDESNSKFDQSAHYFFPQCSLRVGLCVGYPEWC